MKVCLINNLYKPYNRGGAERYVENLFKGFSGLSDDVVVISTKPYGKKLGEEKDVYYLNSLYFNLSKFPKLFRFFWHLFNIINIYKYFQVRKIIKKEKPSLVITNNLVGLGFLLPMLFFNKNIKHLHVLHDIQLLHPSGMMFLGMEDLLDGFFPRVYQKINIYIFSVVKYVVAPSEWIISLHKKKGFFKNAQTLQIFNPIDYSSLPEKLKQSDFLDFVYVGQIEEHKGVVKLFEVMERLIHNNKNIRFLVIGDGSLYPKFSEKYKYIERIKFYGRLNKKEIIEKLTLSDCLIAPSLCYENSPTVIYEAAICNLDFIFSDFGGASEIGKYFSGIGFNPYKDGSLPHSIKEYIGMNKNINQANKKALNLSADAYINKVLDFLSPIQRRF
ncbi:MAG: glycosyltransferase [Patescibacteria group bacterium]|jgi:glycosyltransferase involved in cell wall biosynthesis|nr:glycosyltransferase [Patescibacteria group bacterium]